MMVLKFLKSGKTYRYYELPQYVQFNNRTYNMNSPANLIRALNISNNTLHDIFVFDDCVSKENQIFIRMKTVLVKLTIEQQNELLHQRKLRKHVKMMNDKYRKCAVCSQHTIRSKKMLGTCSVECRKVKLLERNNAVKLTHWAHSDNAITVHQKRISTRKKNDKLLNRIHVPWNKGKTNIYSAETKKKISDAALKQFQEQKFRKTKCELAYESILRELGVNYTYSFIYERRQFDFYLPDVKTFVEIHGDFWHGNPRIWGVTRELRDHQIQKQNDDKIKQALVELGGYRYKSFWEYDITRNRDVVVNETKGLIAHD